jgi:hypothetical protein
METRGEEIHLDKEEARAGSTPGIARYVLLVSTALAAIALSVIWITGALTTSDRGESQAPTQQGTQEGPGDASGN